MNKEPLDARAHGLKVPWCPEKLRLQTQTLRNKRKRGNTKAKHSRNPQSRNPQTNDTKRREKAGAGAPGARGSAASAGLAHGPGPSTDWQRGRRQGLGDMVRHLRQEFSVTTTPSPVPPMQPGDPGAPRSSGASPWAPGCCQRPAGLTAQAFEQSAPCVHPGPCPPQLPLRHRQPRHVLRPTPAACPFLPRPATWCGSQAPRAVHLEHLRGHTRPAAPKTQVPCAKKLLGRTPADVSRSEPATSLHSSEDSQGTRGGWQSRVCSGLGNQTTPAAL